MTHRKLCGLLLLAVSGCSSGEPSAPDLAAAEDLAMSDDLPLPPDQSGPCGGATVYRVASGTYRTTGVTAIQDGCNLGLNAGNLSSDRQVSNDGQGNITVTPVGATVPIGMGPVQCNSGTLTRSKLYFQNGGCRYASEIAMPTTVTGNDQLTLEVTDQRTEVMQVSGAPPCPMPVPSCTVKYTLTIAK